MHTLLEGAIESVCVFRNIFIRVKHERVKVRNKMKKALARKPIDEKSEKKEKNHEFLHERFLLLLKP